MSTHFFGLKDWTFSYSHTVGRNEFAGTGFRNPVDLAVAADDVLYVVSRSSDYRTDGVRITVCTLNEEYISEFGAYGEGDGQFTWPSSIAVDSQDRVYLADEWLKPNHHFRQRRRVPGQMGHTWFGRRTGGPARGIGHKYRRDDIPI